MGTKRTAIFLPLFLAFLCLISCSANKRAQQHDQNGKPWNEKLENDEVSFQESLDQEVRLTDKNGILS